MITFPPQSITHRQITINEITLALAALSMTACKKANTGEEWMALVVTYTYDDGFHEDFNVSDELRIEYEE